MNGGPGNAAAFCPEGPEVLRRLGVNVYAPLSSLRGTFEHVLPAASSYGYFDALRRAMQRGEVRAADSEDQLRWLADHLRLVAADLKPLSAAWRNALTGAAAAVGAPAPVELSPTARRVLVGELLRRPPYQQRLEDALLEALRVQLSR